MKKETIQTLSLIRRFIVGKDVSHVVVNHPNRPVKTLLDVVDEAILDVAEDANALTEEPFQKRVAPWMQTCFGEEISNNTVERNHRFVEESLELAQSKGCTRSEAHQLVDYVWNRPVGEPSQEVGGVMVTLAALCLAANLDMHECGEIELARILDPVIMKKIRAKQAAKPAHSPLPGYAYTESKGSRLKRAADAMAESWKNMRSKYHHIEIED